jgi:hypothetical protein
MSAAWEAATISETMPSQRNEHFLTWVLPCLVMSVFLVLATLPTVDGWSRKSF